MGAKQSILDEPSRGSKHTTYLPWKRMGKRTIKCCAVQLSCTAISLLLVTPTSMSACSTPNVQGPAERVGPWTQLALQHCASPARETRESELLLTRHKVCWRKEQSSVSRSCEKSGSREDKPLWKPASCLHPEPKDLLIMCGLRTEIKSREEGRQLHQREQQWDPSWGSPVKQSGASSGPVM